MTYTTYGQVEKGVTSVAQTREYVSRETTPRRTCDQPPQDASGRARSYDRGVDAGYIEGWAGGLCTGLCVGTLAGVALYMAVVVF
jgi:predicted lipid-binding transport protein (Tim44 family)